MATRTENERKFSNWEELSNGKRRYWRDVEGRRGRWLRYVKIVDANETTLSFMQEIYDHTGALVEIHEKFPADKGHRRVEGN
jgi:hypothetical protein